MKPLRWRRSAYLVATLAVLVSSGKARAQYGVVLSGAGPVNWSMAGASTAAPVNSSGAMYWNPATLSGLQRSELDAGAGVIFAHNQLASSVPANGFGPGFPPVPLSGTTNSDRGGMPVPSIGLAYIPEDSRLSFGLGMFAVAGFGLDYPASVNNPILTPQPPNGLGFGAISSDYQVLQITPGVSYRVTDRLSVGAGPILDMAILRLSPAAFAAPDNANGDPFATYPPGLQGQTTWGGGFIGGVFYQGDSFGLGASVKSPQWFDTFRFNSTNELGQPRDLRTGLDLPMIVSVGASYTGWERLLLALDVRYLDYANANGFGDRGFTPQGALAGVGWRSIFAVATGAQYQLTDALVLRGGYSWNQSPIRGSQATANVASSVIMEHTLYAGLSWNVSECLTLNASYIHAFENSVEGPITTPVAVVPGTSVRSSTSADVILFGATVKFGGPRRCSTCANLDPPRMNEGPPVGHVP